MIPLAILLGGATLAQTAPAPNVPPLAAAVRAAATPLPEGPRAFDPVLALARDADVVLLGEATHGTEEFYRARADLTRRLIAEHGFDAVVIEGDWPDAQRVNRFVLGEGPDRTPEAALGGFVRFPRWLWRNTAVRDFVAWLRTHNAARPADRTNFYGMDLYSLATSRQEVLRALQTLDPDLARRAADRYACLATLAPDTARSAPATLDPDACAHNVRGVFEDVRRLTAARRTRGDGARETLFDLEQNARVVNNAVEYERVGWDLFGSSSWNVRDEHMFETVEAIRAHLGANARVVVWAHNSHIGDARATEMARRGELNLGQLVRQRHGARAWLLGGLTHRGTVVAATEWGGPARRATVRPSLEGSHERLLHDTGLPRFLLDLRRAPVGMEVERLERAIGVQYLPETERQSHYFGAVLPRQFDAVLYFDVTRGVEPLDPLPEQGR